MKKLILFIAILTSIVITACTGNSSATATDANVSTEIKIVERAAPGYEHRLTNVLYTDGTTAEISSFSTEPNGQAFLLQKGDTVVKGKEGKIKILFQRDREM